VVKKVKKIKKWKKILLSFIAVIFAFGVVMCINLYDQIFSPNLQVPSDKEQYLYIPTGSAFIDVLRVLQQKNMLRNSASFQWVAERMEYTNKVRPGRYKVKQGMSNKQLITLLRSGKQTPLQLIFNNVRTIYELGGIVGSQIEADSLTIVNMLADNIFIEKNGFNTDNILSMFIPNTYEFYWNTSAEQFFNRMQKEYEKYWSPERRDQARSQGLDVIEVSILASIVEKETNRNDEKPVIAGVYLNRLKKGWKLEADPTLVYALGDFSVRRVLNEYKEIDSPYNTYQHTGLPPGPICLPSMSSLNAVLHSSKHEYMFFCAKDDFSGYHAFAKDYATHLLNARRFQKELNRRSIRS
jgi:UPF0755 protein